MPPKPAEFDSSNTGIPDSDRPVFLLTNGRTGSTWLQRTLSTHPDLVVWGEHYGFLHGLSVAYQGFKRDERKWGYIAHSSREQKAFRSNALSIVDVEWITPLSLDALRDALRDTIKRLFDADNGRWGFKEIRYDSWQTIRFLSELFPHGKFLNLRRLPVDNLASMWRAWIGKDEYDLNDLREYVRLQANKLEKHLSTWTHAERTLGPDRFQVVHYENLKANFPDELERILRFLDLDPSRMDPVWIAQLQSERSGATRRHPDLRKAIEHIWNSIPTTSADLEWDENTIAATWMPMFLKRKGESLVATNGDPRLLSPPLRVHPADLQCVTVDLEVSHGGPASLGEVFFRTEDMPEFEQALSAQMVFTAGRNKVQFAAPAPLKAEQGEICQIRLDPVATQGAHVRIHSIKVELADD